MEKSRSVEKEANLYAGRQLRAVRGDLSRVAFGSSIGMKESLLHSYESGDVNISVAKMARIARTLGIPLSTFILPDDDPALIETYETEEEKTEA